MTNRVNHMPSSSVTLSMMISEIVYRVVCAVEQLLPRVSK